MKKQKIHIPRSGYTQKSKEIDKARAEGFWLGLMCSCAVLNDRYDFPNDDLRDVIEQSDVLLESISKNTDDPKYIIRELQKMTGVELVGDE